MFTTMDSEDGEDGGAATSTASEETKDKEQVQQETASKSTTDEQSLGACVGLATIETLPNGRFEWA